MQTLRAATVCLDLKPIHTCVLTQYAYLCATDMPFAPDHAMACLSMARRPDAAPVLVRPSLLEGRVRHQLVTPKERAVAEGALELVVVVVLPRELRAAPGAQRGALGLREAARGDVDHLRATGRAHEPSAFTSDAVRVSIP